jgi:hypothetical protein
MILHLRFDDMNENLWPKIKVRNQISNILIWTKLPLYFLLNIRELVPWGTLLFEAT